MTAYNPAVAKLGIPPRIAKLPLDERGYPVPKFVEWIDDKPDFRVMNARHLVRCVAHRLCWLCGEPLGRHMAFVIGPMCCINRTSAEPPSHLDCALFAVKACPFLTQPKRPRNPHGLPEQHEKPAGLMIERNPGVMLVWVTETYKRFNANGGMLFEIGEPTRLEWYAHGQKATREQIMDSINSGLPILQNMADIEGADAQAELSKRITRGLALVPAA